jgi:choline kinase
VTKVALLAAGVGNRLDPSGQAPPKALLRFAGRSLLQRHLEILGSFGLGDVTIVVGHQATAIERELAAIGAGERVRTLFNPDYRASSLLSLWMLRDVLQAGQPVLYMDADVLYDRRLLERLLRAPHDDCILIDRDIDPDDEWLDVRLRTGRIVAFDKGVRLEDYDVRAEWVGFARFSAGAAARLATAIDGYVERGRVDVSYEAPMRDVILETPRFGTADATGLPWIEIDFPEDLRRAQREILPRLVGLPRTEL